jgi:SecD/SecF fusion protein
MAPGAWGGFAEGEMQIVSDALQRSEATTTSNVGPSVARELAGLAIVAIVLSWLVIIIYLWKRFGSVQWGLAAVICLIHDVVIVVGLVAVSGWIHDTVLGSALLIDSFKIDLPMVAAMLTVIGYSVNDTIVVFDRIRENRGKLSAVSMQVINDSINQTLPRTLLTSFTTFMVVLIMYVWGGPAIHPYNYVLLAGILFGTYSSIAVASPLIVGFKRALVAKVAPTTT